MKNVVTIVDLYYGSQFENKQGFKTTLVNMVLLEPLKQFRITEDGEKELVSVRQLALRVSDFLRMLVLDETLALMDKETSSAEDEKIKFLEEYKNFIKVLKGAKLTLQREELTSKKFDVNKPLVDKDGKPLVNEDGEVMYDLLRDAEGNPVEDLIGFGETTFVKLELTSTAKRLAEKLVFG